MWHKPTKNCHHCWKREWWLQNEYIIHINHSNYHFFCPRENVEVYNYVIENLPWIRKFGFDAILFMQILYLSSLGETLLTIYNLRFTKQVYKKQYEHPNLPSNAFNIVKVKVKRFIGQPQGTGLTNYNTKQIQTKKIKKQNEKCNALIYTLEINMMANLQLYLQIHILALYSYDIHASLLILYLHSIHVKW